MTRTITNGKSSMEHGQARSRSPQSLSSCSERLDSPFVCVTHSPRNSLSPKGAPFKILLWCTLSISGNRYRHASALTNGLHVDYKRQARLILGLVHFLEIFSLILKNLDFANAMSSVMSSYSNLISSDIVYLSG